MERQCPNVSVIVPVYNSEQYLEVSIKSLLNQTLENFEILLVDDGSTDASGKICDQFALKDSRIRVFHKANGGICSARNYGIKEAQGDYITFMDNDDEVMPNLLLDNYTLAKEGSFDIVRFGNEHVITIGDRVISKKIYTCLDKEYYGNAIWAEYLDFHTKFTKAVWSGLFKREFLAKHQLLFDEQMKYGYEDRDFFVRTSLKAESIAGNSRVYYIWRQREEHSTSMKKGENVLEERVKSLLTIANHERELIHEIGSDKFPLFIWSKLMGIYYIRTLADILDTSGGNDLLWENRKTYWETFYQKAPRIERATLKWMCELLKYNKFVFLRNFLFKRRCFRSIELIYQIRKKKDSRKIDGKCFKKSFEIYSRHQDIYSD